MHPYKILVIGFPKSGTTSLHRAFLASEIESYHWKIRGTKSYLGQIVYENFYIDENIFSSFDQQKCIAITQADVCRPRVNLWPQLDYTLLQKNFQSPATKYILNYRDPHRILHSIKKSGNLHSRLCTSKIPHLKGKEDKDFVEWMTCHFEYCRKLFSYDKEKFLEIDIEKSDVKFQLENFLNCEIRWWGQSNRSS